MNKPVIVTEEDRERYNKYLRRLSLYYRHLFPVENIHKWLNRLNRESSYFSKREFALVKRDVQKNKIYSRYNSFMSLYWFRKRIQYEVPHTIEIGAVMSQRPINARIGKHWYAVEKELVFDIDVSDYDEVRMCCRGASICQKCWKFMVVACKILRMVLQDDFGFEEMLWVFSGRRGIHCWVSDQTARSLTKELRESLVNYFMLPLRFLKRNDELQIKWEHPLIQKTLRIVKEYFEEICLEDQDFFSSWKSIEKFLINEIPGEQNRRNLREVIDNVHSHGSVVIWSAFCAFVESLEDRESRNCDLIESIQLYLLYPRLDLNVTKQIEHLLKTPFSIHPDTQKVAIPLDPDNIESFNIDTVPTLSILTREIRDCLAKNVPVVKSSLMYPSLIFFKDFVEKIK
ncbi:DNA primase small subunit-like isoform X1 [Lutzomyia longipalpis]|uniref:DNA primase small subunit-like isoform X1 n=1 Tax=Lutzomyia longipalpis TaxID=7200 RepID=UPI002483BACF|nr:DNA primase small subunit-like isoform X1 [Lutzomyia longipalpis]